jgi:preprotein translocase subunit SecB
MSGEEQKSLYPIQLSWIAVRELSIKLRSGPDRTFALPEGEFAITDGRSEYDEKKHTVQVGVKVEIGKTPESQHLPFTLVAEIWGEFRIDESRFPRDKIDVWATINAPYVLYPYLREHVYALTSRSGFPGVILPLMQIPTMRVTSPAELFPEPAIE